MRTTLFKLRILLLCMPVLWAADPVDVYQRPRQAERSRDYDVQHYRIRLTLDEATRSYHGSTEISLRPLRDGFEVCELDAETFTVTEVRDDRGGALKFRQQPGKLAVYLPHAAAHGTKLAFTVHYHAENVAVDSEKFGMPREYDLGLSFQPETPDHPRVTRSLSFPTGARHWFPCYDHPNGKATSEVIATVDSRNQVISNGKLIGTTEDAAKHQKTFHWSQDRPHSTYLFVLVAGPYVKVSDTLGPLPIGYWVYQKDAPDARRSFGKTPEIIAFFNEEFGYAYPWVKYDQIAIPHFGGGAESTNATVVGDNTLHDEKADKDFPSHWLVAHEAAHQWWGDLITMRDWSQTWLNEGFATYSEYLYSKHTLGEDEGALNLRAKQDQYFIEARQKYRRPIVFDRWEVPNDNFDRHTYQKAAAVLVMLRWVMGDEPFRRGMAHFLRKHAYQSVDTHDLQISIREATGQVLDWFFDQWIYQAGHPVFQIGYTWNAESRKVRLKVTQVQELSAHVPVFQTPVVIGITTPAGHRAQKVWIRKQEETFELDCAEKPLLVRFDEGNYLLKEAKFPKAVEELLYQLSHDDAMGRMDAAIELRPHAAEAAVTAALRQSATGDKFWAVRREALFSVPFAGIDFLKQMSVDHQSAVRAAALRLLGDRKQSGLADFLEQRFRDDDSYVAQAEAIRALGKCGARSAIPFLQKAAGMRSPSNIIGDAATRALKEIQN